MKTSLLVISIFLSCTIGVMGQNYMGVSQAKIIKSIGEPDKVGYNYYVYNDLNEKGENIYYFDAKGNCNSFQIIRNLSYLKEYQRILENEFTETCKNMYVKKTKKINYLAELTLAEEKFQIKIHDNSDSLIPCNVLAEN